MTNVIQKNFQKWCALGIPYHMTFAVLFFVFASASLFLQNRFLSWVFLLPLFVNLILRELCDANVLSTVVMKPDFPHVPTPLPIPERYPRTLPTPTMPLPSALGGASATAPVATAPVAPVNTNMGDARSFWEDSPALQGRSIAPSSSGRGYAHYIPGSMA